MKFKRISAAALALSMLSATTAIVVNASSTAVEFTKDEDGYYIANGLNFSEREDGTLGVVGLADSDEKETVTEISIPEEVDGRKVIEIYSSAFMGCTNLTNITIPDSVTDIGGLAFENTPWFESKKEENPLVIIGKLLYDATACTGDVVIPDGITDIGIWAFAGCDNITSVTIPDSVTEIDGYNFTDCKSLTSVTIPVSVTKISFMAFSGCPSFTDVYYTGSKDEWNKIADELNQIEDSPSALLNANIHYNYVPETPDNSDDSNSSDSETSSDSESNSSAKTEEFKSGEVKAEADEGVVPEGAELSVEKTEKDGEYTYDIKFTKDGKEVKPDGTVTVKLPLPEALKGKDVYVYYIEDGKVKEDMKATVKGNYVEFTTTHFSEYLLTGEQKEVEASPDTGFAGVAMTLGVIALAGAAVVVSRKRK